VVLFVVLAAIIRHGIFDNGKTSYNNEACDWVSENIFIMAPVISFVIVSLFYLWIETYHIKMRPAVESVYIEFRENPENWSLSGDVWIRKSDGLRFNKDRDWMAPYGKNSFKLTEIEDSFLKLAIYKRSEDADKNRYKEFEENSKVEELIK